MRTSRPASDSWISVENVGVLTIFHASPLIFGKRVFDILLFTLLRQIKKQSADCLNHHPTLSLGSKAFPLEHAGHLVADHVAVAPNVLLKGCGVDGVYRVVHDD